MKMYYDNHIVYVISELSLYDVGELNKIIKQKFPDYDITIDLTDCSFLDSSAIGALLALDRKCKKYSGFLVLQNIPSSLTRVLLKSGISDLFTIR